MKKINLKGPFVSNSEKEIYDYYNIEATCAKDVSDALENDEDVILEVNSNGGLVTAGSEIYTLLRQYKGNVTANVVGMAASAASVAIMGADKICVSPTAQIMIHKASLSYLSGNSDDLDKASDALKSADQAICNAYKAKTKMSDDELLELMKNETFMTAQKAVELGFADEVMFEDNQNAPELVAAIGTGMLPVEVINSYRIKKAKQKEIKELLNEIEKQEILNDL